MPVQTICPKCKGTGKTTIPSGKRAGQETDCENCGGRGKMVTKQGSEPGEST
jgi:DnaJ-class molecular chaperone